jgi:tetratricopeptide (TPR) repeat protein
VLSLKPNAAETHNNLGKVYYLAKRNQEAVTSFKSAIKLRQNFAEAHFNLAVAYVALGDKKGVLEEYKTLKTIDPALAEKFASTFLKGN